MPRYSPQVQLRAFSSRAGYEASPTPTPPPAPPIPAPGDLVAHWDATEITPQTDNTNLTSWVDLIGGLNMVQATGAQQPKYRTGAGAGAVGGQATVQFAGSQYLACTSTGTPLKAVIDARTYTIMVIMVSGNGPTNEYGTAFSASDTNAGVNVVNAGDYLGVYGSAEQAVTSLNTFVTFGIGGSTAGGTRLAVNGGVIGQGADGPKGTVVSTFEIGHLIALPAQYGIIGSICEIAIWDKALSPVEMLQFDDYARYKYDQVSPRDGLAKFVMFDGDSITAGQGADNMRYIYPRYAAANASLAYGQYTNFAKGGSTWSDMITRSGEIDDVVEYLGSTPTQLCVWEFYNSRAVNLSTLVTSQITPYLQARYASGVDRITFGTTCDYTGAGAEKTNYDAYWDVSGNRTGLMNDYVAIHLNSSIGTNGTSANATYFSDGVHLTGKANYPGTQSGYPVLAGLFSAFI